MFCLQINVYEVQHCLFPLVQCFSTFFWTWRTILCGKASRHTNVQGGDTAGDSGLHAHSLPSAVVISGCLWT
jgi:hypothetical protein